MVDLFSVLDVLLSFCLFTMPDSIALYFIPAGDTESGAARNQGLPSVRQPRARARVCALRVSFRRNRAKLGSQMPNSNKTQRKGIDDTLRDRARRLTQRVEKDQRHLDEIGREVKAIKMIARKHAKRHR